MDALMYGVIDIANNVALANAPPDSISRYPSAEPLPATVSIKPLNASAFRKGTGMTEPILKMMMINSVNSNFFLRSGKAQAFRIVLNNSDHLCLPTCRFNLLLRSFGISTNFHS